MNSWKHLFINHFYTGKISSVFQGKCIFYLLLLLELQNQEHQERMVLSTEHTAVLESPLRLNLHAIHTHL